MPQERAAGREARKGREEAEQAGLRSSVLPVA